MKKDASMGSKGATVTTPGRKPYKRPYLQTFGKLHLLTQGTGPANGDGGQGMMQPSDRATKENIVRIGTHPLGIGVYLFNYKPEYREQCGHGTHVGVMADEVETVVPAAVCMHPDGYKMVDYSMLRAHSTLQ